MFSGIRRQAGRYGIGLEQPNAPVREIINEFFVLSRSHVVRPENPRRFKVGLIEDPFVIPEIVLRAVAHNDQVVSRQSAQF